MSSARLGDLQLPALWVVRLTRGAQFLLLAAAGLLVARRLAGAFDRPLSWSTLLLLGVLGSGWLLLANGTRPGRASWKTLLVLALALLGAGVAVCVPGTTLRGRLAGGLPWVAAIVVCGWTTRRRPVAEQEPSRDALSLTSVEPLEARESIRWTQELSRGVSGDGFDQVEGVLHVEFSAGARSQETHVAFCPPFWNVPTIDWEQTEGPECRIELGQALPQGARFDLKLDRTGPATISLAFVARCGVEPPEGGSP